MSRIAEIISPLEQEGTKSVVRAWLKNPGEAVCLDDPLVELETDKVAVEVPAPADGVLEEILVEVGAEAPPGMVLGRMRTGAASEKPRHTANASSPASHPGAKPSSSIAQFDQGLRLSPSVRRLLVENDLDPSALRGSGRDGRITSDDVKRALTAKLSTTPAHARVQLAQLKSTAGARIAPHDSMRRRIAEHMAHSLATAPHVTALFEADFTAIQAHRKAHKAEFERKGINLTFTAYFIAAAVEAMKVSPNVNSRWHEDHLEIFEDVNVGVGTSLGDKGLIVPVIHRAQILGFEAIAARLHEVTEKARSGKLAPADVQNGTFSISNHGVSGSLLAAPIIINQPQSAILGVGKNEKRVVVREADGGDAIQIRPMAYVSLTIDHRVLDGHQTNAWLTRFVEVLETWPATQSPQP
jgi:2-oxoglutarate dehydrogenase E2 component (dihydrolipoamide succinyltransferase)